MKRSIVVLTVAILMLGVLAVGAGHAKAEDAREKCSEATLEGRYLFAYDGVEIQGNEKVPFAVAGFSVNGKITSKQPFSGPYTVKEDCTGTVTVQGTHSDVFIAPDGSMFTWVYTDPGVVAAGFELRGTAKRVGD